jgi:CheY-like chemotaxis protein
MSQQTRITATPAQQAAHAPQFASILILDDEEFDRKKLQKLCRGLAFTTHVIEAASLAELRSKLSKDRFDLILLDYHLPDGTGLDGVEIIRADPVNCHAATVMITGTDQADIAIAALKLGFSDYLIKEELSAQTLERAAVTALQKSQLARGMAAHAAPPVPMNGSVQSFSRARAQDIKPVVSRIMRQRRGLRDIEQITAEDATRRVELVEGSLRNLWAFLDDLDHLGADRPAQGPTVSMSRNAALPASVIVNARVPTYRPKKLTPESSRPPSIFRRRPD